MNLVLLPVIAPFFASPALLYLSNRWRRLLLLLYMLMMILVAAYILSGVELGETAFFTTTFMQESGMAPLHFAEHPYGKIAAFGFLLVGALALLYGLDVAKASEQASALVAIGSAVGIAFSGNFITLFIFWELLTVSTAFLIILNRTPHSLQMGYRFLLIHLAGGLLLFMGIMQHYAATGSLLIATPEAGLPFFVLGIGFKAVFLPLHVWLPMGYPAASFASSVVLAGLTTKVGVYAVARILPPSELISLMGASMAIFGAYLAVLQSDLRRLLSYHIISQVGFMVAGVGLGLSLSVDGGLLHVVNHMLYKALLFMSAGALIFSTEIENVKYLDTEELKLPPVWLILPKALVGAVVGALAIAGMPPFNGFVSKYLLKQGTYGIEPVATMLMIAGIGTSLSFSKFVYFGFIRGRARLVREKHFSMRAAILIVSACCLILGIWPQILAPILPHGSSLDIYSLSGAWDAIAIILTGIVFFVLMANKLLKGIYLPEWCSLENSIYRPLFTLLFNAYTYIGRAVEAAVDGVIVKGINPLAEVSRKVARWDDSLEFTFFQPALDRMLRFSHTAAHVDDLATPKFFEPTINAMARFARAFANFDESTISRFAARLSQTMNQARDMIYNGWLLIITNIESYWRYAFRRLFFSIIKVDYDHKSESFFQKYSMMNIDINFVIIIFVLLLALGAGFVFLYF